jgi:kanamycin kinase/aminoglycoside 3'-phosphotransferase-3
MKMNELNNLPESIRRFTEGRAFDTNDLGKSGSPVRIYDDFVLKVEQERPKFAQMVEVMQWLDGKLPVPKVLATEVKDGYRYLLMSKVRGRMALDEYYLNRPEELVTLLAEALKMLWSVDISDCPKTFDLDGELEEARYRVEHNLVDIDDAEPETFGEGGFKDPQELLQWLYDHKPEPDPVFSHGDFCLPNVFFEDGKVSGFIDLGDAGIADRWYDIALGYRSLKHNVDGHYGKVYEGVDPDELFTKLGLAPDWEKIRYYILLDELF